MALFRSALDEAVYFAAYDAMLARWPVPTTRRYVPTSFGPTHIVDCGQRDAKPLVLLPAVSVSSAAWFANVEVLGRSRRLFAIDIIGDAGKSTLERKPRDPADYAKWLSETFAGLGLDRPDVVGHSYGGWLTLLLGLHAKRDVGSIILLAPSSGLAPFHWYMKLFLSVAERLPFKPNARSTLQMQAHRGYRLDETFVKLMEAMTAHARTNVLFPRPLSDDALRSIDTPALVLIGDQEVLYDGREALERARRLMPNVTGRIVAGCSHLLIMERPEEINRAILEFLSGPKPLLDGSELQAH